MASRVPSIWIKILTTRLRLSTQSPGSNHNFIGTNQNIFAVTYVHRSVTFISTYCKRETITIFIRIKDDVIINLVIVAEAAAVHAVRVTSNITLNWPSYLQQSINLVRYVRIEQINGNKNLNVFSERTNSCVSFINESIVTHCLQREWKGRLKNHTLIWRHSHTYKLDTQTDLMHNSSTCQAPCVLQRISIFPFSCRATPLPLMKTVFSGFKTEIISNRYNGW